ncbi:hypothetical protein AB0B59_23835 [Streptomyces huasconensis]|uniref:hypothetical protein n=1 Tax=Streptomyces huasconensis TaxID=1854574 RepID=UPI0033C6631E
MTGAAVPPSRGETSALIGWNRGRRQAWHAPARAGPPTVASGDAETAPGPAAVHAMVHGGRATKAPAALLSDVVGERVKPDGRTVRQVVH